MRSTIPTALLVALALTTIPVCAASSDQPPSEQQAIEALEARANQAKPRDQCFLYAQLMHRMTEFSMRLYAAGNVTKATLLLKQIQNISRKVHLSVSEDDKRLKNAEILLSRTTFRLTELLHSSDYQDRPLIRQTIADVNQAQNATLMEVFSK